MTDDNNNYIGCHYHCNQKQPSSVEPRRGIVITPEEIAFLDALASARKIPRQPKPKQNPMSSEALQTMFGNIADTIKTQQEGRNDDA